MLEETDLFERVYEGKKKDSTCGIGEIVTGEMYKNPPIKRFLENPYNFSLTFNTDGIQVFNSNRESLWPILCTLNELIFSIKSQYSLLQGLWLGKKPDQKVFLRPFVEEARELYFNGFKWKDRHGVERHSKVAVLIGVLDGPARSCFLCRHQWNGAFGCIWCEHEGESVPTFTSNGKRKGSTRTYPVNISLPNSRTNREEFENGKAASKLESTNGHVKGSLGLSLLFLLPLFDTVVSMIPDSMHCVYLGVTKTFMETWFKLTKRDFFIKNKCLIDKILQNVKPPDEILRTYRCIQNHFSDWKASEFRNFLLIYSPAALVDILPQKYYEHWLLLVNFMRLLTKKVISDIQIKTCNEIAINFAKLIPELYGKQYVRANVHFLKHLVESVKAWGAPWASSAFIFESLGGMLAECFKGSKMITKQIFSNFFARRRVTSFAEKYIVKGSDPLIKFYKTLDHFYLKKSNIGKQEPLGKIEYLTLNQSVKSAIVNYLGKEFLCENVRSCGRFMSNCRSYCTAGYSKNFKRDNSIVRTTSGVFQIESILFFDKDCMCSLSGDCSSNAFYEEHSTVLFIGRSFKCDKMTPIFENTTKIDLVSFMCKVKIDKTNVLTAFPPRDVLFKCVLIPKSHDTFCVDIDSVFEGN